MQRVYKYPLGLYGRTVVQMPVGATIISVGVQTANGKDHPVIWAIVNPDEKRIEMRSLYVVATGEQFERGERDQFLGTNVTPGGYVFHTFEVRP